MRTKTPRLSTWTLCLLAGLGTQACGDDGAGDGAADTTATSTGTGTDTGTMTMPGEGTTDSTVDDTGTTEAPPSVTFWQDIAPIYYQSCVSCHREGSIAPFPLDTYEDAQAWAVASAAAVQARTMPPWGVIDDGSCGDFRDSRWLDQADVDLIAAWVDEGTAEGEPRDDLVVPDLPGLGDGLDIQTPNFTPAIEGGELAEFDEYRCFLVDPELTGDRFLTAYDVLPGNDAIVHHVLLMPVDPDLEVGGPFGGQTNAEVMQALDDESPERDGWPCFGAAGEGVDENGIPVVWAPGQGVVNYPEGTGLRVGQNNVFVIQVHYNLANPDNIGMSDQTTVRLQLEEEVEREGFLLLPDPFLESIFEGDPIELPPGQESVPYTWDLSIADILAFTGLTSIELHGVFPHMHEFGQAMNLEIDGPDGLQCFADVPNWDFNWQLQYFYEEGHTLTTDDTLRVTCDFNTSGVDEPVTPGWGTNNEMCLMGLYLVP